LVPIDNVGQKAYILFLEVLACYNTKKDRVDSVVYEKDRFP